MQAPSQVRDSSLSSAAGLRAKEPPRWHAARGLLPVVPVNEPCPSEPQQQQRRAADIVHDTPRVDCLHSQFKASEACAGSRLTRGFEEECLTGDPWEGCEDVAAEDLADWLIEYVELQQVDRRRKLYRSQTQRVRNLAYSMLGRSPEPTAGRGWAAEGVKHSEGEKMSMNSVSTMSSLGYGSTADAPSTPSTACSLTFMPASGDMAHPAQDAVLQRSWSGHGPIRGWGAPPAAAERGRSVPKASSLASGQARPDGAEVEGSVSPQTQQIVEEDVEFILRGLWIT